jgi:hypothetical protein
MRRHSVARLPSRTNVITLSSINQEIKEFKREVREIRRMIEIQTEILEGLLDNYRQTSPRKAQELITTRVDMTEGFKDLLTRYKYDRLYHVTQWFRK